MSLSSIPNEIQATNNTNEKYESNKYYIINYNLFEILLKMLMTIDPFTYKFDKTYIFFYDMQTSFFQSLVFIYLIIIILRRKVFFLL